MTKTMIISKYGTFFLHIQSMFVFEGYIYAIFKMLVLDTVLMISYFGVILKECSPVGDIISVPEITVQEWRLGCPPSLIMPTVDDCYKAIYLYSASIFASVGHVWCV